MTEEHKKKISIANTGKKRSREFIEKIRNINLGKKLSEETKLKMSLSHKKLPKRDVSYLHHPDVVKKSALSKKGKPWSGGKTTWGKGSKHTQESKDKISLANKNRKISPETRNKLRIVNSGSKSRLWKGGTTILNQQIRTCFKYRQWRSDVFERDNYTCMNCGKRGGYKEAHHLKALFKIIEEYNIKNIDDALECEELWNINNGRTLCKSCHKQTDTYGNYISKNKTKF